MKPPKKKWRSLASVEQSPRERLLAWAARWFNIEKAGIKARIAIARPTTIEEKIASQFVQGLGESGFLQAAAVFARTAADAELVAVLAPEPTSRGYAAVIVMRSREGEFFARRYSSETIDRTTMHRTQDLDASAFDGYDDFTEQTFFVDPALEGRLAEKGFPGAVQHRAPVHAPVIFAASSDVLPERTERTIAPRPDRARDLEGYPWETGRIHAQELTDVTPGPHASDVHAFVPATAPVGLERRSLDELVRSAWSNEPEAIVLVEKVVYAKDSLGALRFFLGSGVPELAKMYACAACAHKGRNGDDRELALEASHGLVDRIRAVGDPMTWLASFWPDRPTIRDTVGTIAIACLGAAAFWRIAHAVSAEQTAESSSLERALADAESLRDRLLDRCGAPSGTPGTRIAKLAAIVLGTVPSDRGEPRLTRWQEATREREVNQPAELTLRHYAAMYAAMLHSTTVVTRLMIDRVRASHANDAALWRPHEVPLDGLLGFALEVVARHLAGRAEYGADEDETLRMLERARDLAEWNPIFASLFNEARFRARRWDEALLADLEKETSRAPSVGAAAELLRVAEHLQNRHKAKIARKRLLASSKKTKHEWLARVRVAFGRPHEITDVDRVIELELEAPEGEADASERAVLALLDGGTVAQLVLALTAQRETLEGARKPEPPAVSEPSDTWASSAFEQLRSVWPILARASGDIVSLRRRAIELQARVAIDDDRAAIDRDIVDLIAAAQTVPELPLDAGDEDDEDDFKRMTLAPWALERSERQLGTPVWAIAKGLEAISRYNASRGQRRDLKRLQGRRQCELRIHDSRNPVRVNYVLGPSGPLVVGIIAKQDEAHQNRMIDRIEGWLDELDLERDG